MITYYVGNALPISAKSGAKISLPHPRAIPLTNKSKIYGFPNTFPQNLEGSEFYDYVSLSREQKLMSQSLHSISSDKSTHSDSFSQASLDIRAPAGLLEELAYVPDKILACEGVKKQVQKLKPVNGSKYDLAQVSSIILPGTQEKMEESTLNPEIIQLVNTRLLEASDRAVAYHVTKVDWDVLQGIANENEENSSKSESNNFYDLFFQNSQYRWNSIIERSLSLSHFVIVTILGAEVREELFSKWIRIADELRTSMGNFFSFCGVMRGLNSNSLSKCEGPLDWMKLRRDYTNPTFLFETTLRSAYKGLLEGKEPYPPNCTIPNLLTSAIIQENAWELMPGFQNLAGNEKLALTVQHLKGIYLLSRNWQMQKRNLERLAVDMRIPEDLILTDIFRTEVHLIILWGMVYQDISLEQRCRQYDD